MVEREDFYKIAEKTLEEYYSVVYNKKVSISVVSPSIKSKIFVYPKINAITTRFPSKKVIAYSYDEFNVSNNFLKFILAKIYVTLCMFTGGLFAEKSIKYSDYSIFNDNILISPANRKIRIYDFENGVVDAIVKNSFTKRYFENELNFRLNHSYDFIIPIIDHGDNWYREKILPGQPLARIKNERLYNKSVIETISYIKKIAEDTIQLVDSKEYSNNLFKNISQKLLVAKETKKIKYFDIITEIAQIALKKALLLNGPLPLVESHGDLQSGNVWVDKKAEKTYIIDWETHEKRSIWYDCATILLSIRRENKLKEMAENCDTDAIKEALLANDTCKEYNMQAVIGGRA